MALSWQNILGHVLHFTNFWDKTVDGRGTLAYSSSLTQTNKTMGMRSKQRVWIGVLLAMNALGGGWMATSARGAIFDRDGNKLPDREVNSNLVNWKMLRSSPKAWKYNGIGSLDVNYGVCTAFAIDIGNHPQAPAYIVTNGHCQGTADKLPNPQDILVNQPSQSHFIVNYFYDYKSRRAKIPVKRMVYGTMKNNDIAILELTKTQQELKDMGIVSLKIAIKPLEKGQPLAVVGIPSEGVKPHLRYLHKAKCKVGETVHVKEDVYDWNQSIRHNCSIVGGMSGSPMISSTNQVVGIINTGVNDDAQRQPECSLNRPCEVDSSGKKTTYNRENYGQLVDRIPTCFDRQGIFNLQQSSCQLERP
jgi:V8-like Glu-specific endopeptidase